MYTQRDLIHTSHAPKQRQSTNPSFMSARSFSTCSCSNSALLLTCFEQLLCCFVSFVCFCWGEGPALLVVSIECAAGLQHPWLTISSTDLHPSLMWLLPLRWSCLPPGDVRPDCLRGSCARAARAARSSSRGSCPTARTPPSGPSGWRSPWRIAASRASFAVAMAISPCTAISPCSTCHSGQCCAALLHEGTGEGASSPRERELERPGVAPEYEAHRLAAATACDTTRGQHDRSADKMEGTHKATGTSHDVRDGTAAARGAGRGDGPGLRADKIGGQAAHPRIVYPFVCPSVPLSFRRTMRARCCFACADSFAQTCY